MDKDLKEQELDALEQQLDEETLKAIEEALDAEEQKRSKEPTKGEVLANYILEESKVGKVVAYSVISLSPPEGLEKNEVKELLADTTADVALASIGMVAGKKDRYYYNTDHMTERFATVQSLIEDKDILATVAAAARHDCRVYPRPVRVLSLMDSPYFYSGDEILGAIARMKGIPEYEDIDTVTASNGNMCIYSSQYMSKKYANALCEEIEVERQYNQ